MLGCKILPGESDDPTPTSPVQPPTGGYPLDSALSLLLSNFHTVHSWGPEQESTALSPCPTGRNSTPRVDLKRLREKNSFLVLTAVHKDTDYAEEK